MKAQEKSTVLNVLFRVVIISVTILFFASSCGDDAEPLVIQLPTLTTNSVGDITKTTAVAGGVITADGGASVEAHGVCWNTTGNPQITDDKTSDGTGIGSFTSTIEELEINTTYFVRAYASNSEGTAYGQEVSFTTQDLSLLDGIVSYWKLDETTGTVASDATSNWNLNFVNNPEWFSPGKIGNGINFGTSSIQYLEKMAVASGNKNTYTLSAWIYLENDEADVKYIMGMNSGEYAKGAGAAEVKIYLDNANKFVAMYHTTNGALHGTADVMLRTSGTSITLNTWHHVVGVINNGDIALYVNGVVDNTNPVENSGLKSNLYFFNGGRVTVGNARLYENTYIATRWFKGKLDEAGIWDRPLRTKDVQALYNNGVGLAYPF